jgi:hypothetical protein
VVGVHSRVWLALSHAELGEFAEGRAAAAEATALAAASDDTSSRAAADWAAGVVALLAGLVDEALERLERARSAAADTAADLFPLVSAPLGLAQVVAGRIDEGITTLQDAAPAAESRGLVANRSLGLAWLGEGLRRASRLDEAEALAARALDEARRHGERGHEGWALLTRAAVAADRGGPDAEQAYRAAIAHAEELGMVALADRARAELATLRQRRAAR